MAIAPDSKPRAKFVKAAYARMFNNNSDNPNAPTLGNSKVEILEDLKQGDIVSFSGWVNQDEQTGEKSLSITVQKRVEETQQQSPATVTEDDIPF